ncbi:MAG: LacI family DNA-binding transcriptional regulator [Pseudomonadota bacterium]
MAQEGQHKSARRRATSYDVAALAGVSQSAVSRCFKDGASISQKTRAKVLKAAESLNYQPNAIARGLITQRSNLAAVIVSSQINFYYPEVLSQLTEQFAQRGIRVLLFTIQNPSDTDRALDELWRYQVDGVISASYLSRDQYALLEARGIPTVLFNRFFSDRPSHSTWCDPSDATQALVDHLVENGHQHFAMIEGPSDSQVNMIRTRAVERALATHGLQLRARARGSYRYESAGQAVDSLLRARTSMTALICANDMMAMGAIDQLRQQHGLDVPRDISVAGFDGIGAGQFASYTLTTIRQPIARMTQHTVDTLLNDLEGDEKTPERVAFAGEFMRGSSTGKASD